MRDAIWLNPAALLYGVAMLLKAKRAPTKEAQAARAAHAKKQERAAARAGNSHSTSGETDASGKKLPNRDRIGEFTSGAGGGGAGGSETPSGKDGASQQAPRTPRKGEPGYVDNDGSFITDKDGNVWYKQNPKAKYDPLKIERHEKDQGMKWASYTKRIALYHRDGAECAWCGNKAEHGHTLTLDHLTDKKRGGTDEAKNLVTVCMSCNSKRQDQDMNEFAQRAAAWTGTPAGTILARIRDLVAIPVGRAEYAAATKHLLEQKKLGRTFKDAYPVVPEHIKQRRAPHHAHVKPPHQY